MWHDFDRQGFKFFRDLYKCKYINSNRICKLYGSYKSGMRRIKLLADSGYITVVDTLPTGEYVYCLTKKGCGIIKVEYESVTKTDKLNHYLACTDFYFYIKNKLPKQFKLGVQYHFSYNEKKLSFRPDIVYQIDRWYFVEIDLCHRRFEEKVRVWEAFLKSGEFKRYFEKYPPIIIVSTDVEKVQKIINKEQKIHLNYFFKEYDEVKGWDYKYEY